MPASDPLQILLNHDIWATQQILLTCEKISADQFAKKFDIGPGSLQATLTHMIAAKDAWTDTLAQREHRPRVDSNGIAYAPAELITMHERSSAEFVAVAGAHPLDGTVVRVREGKTFTFTRGAVITHLTTHGMHHRAQCFNMLKQLGVKPLPPSSVVEWTRFAENT